MNKKGFTLIELMAVIVILSIIAVVTTPIVINVISNVRHELTKEQKKIVENGARMWGIKNLSLIKGDDRYVPSQNSVSIDELKSEGYIEDKELKSLNLSNEEMSNAGVCIFYDGQYLYEFTNDINDCSF